MERTAEKSRAEMSSREYGKSNRDVLWACVAYLRIFSIKYKRVLRDGDEASELASRRCSVLVKVNWNRLLRKKNYKERTNREKKAVELLQH